MRFNSSLEWTSCHLCIQHTAYKLSRHILGLGALVCRARSTRHCTEAVLAHSHVEALLYDAMEGDRLYLYIIRRRSIRPTCRLVAWTYLHSTAVRTSRTALALPSSQNCQETGDILVWSLHAQPAMQRGERMVAASVLSFADS